jgi:hypothetical protein
MEREDFAIHSYVTLPKGNGYSHQLVDIHGYLWSLIGI